jgi:hypothetical protein
VGVLGLVGCDEVERKANKLKMENGECMVLDIRGGIGRACN